MKYIYNEEKKYLEINQFKKGIIETMTYEGRDRWRYVKKVHGAVVEDKTITTAQARDVWYNHDLSRDSWQKNKMVGFKTSTF